MEPPRNPLPKLFVDEALKMWMVQLLESSLERNPSHIRITLYEKTLRGFDFYDDGDAIPEADHDDLCHAFPEVNRKRNQIYKQRSLL